jgi:hypothetical protein
MRQMIRAAKPGGRIVLTVPQHPFLWSGMDEYACHQRRYTRRELRAKLRRAGAETEYATSFVSILFPVLLATRLLPRRRCDPVEDLSVSRPLNRALAGVLAVERWMLRTGVRFPFGGSLLVVARVPSP